MNIDKTLAPNTPKTLDDLESWVVVSSGAASFLGRELETSEDGVTTLSPAYEYIAQTLIQASGIRRQRVATPIEMNAGAYEVRVRPASRLALSSIPIEGRKCFLDLIDAAEAMRRQLRAEGAGILVAQQIPARGVQ